MLIQFRPIKTWPKKQTAVRRESAFIANYASTLKLLDGELEKINATAVAVQLAVGEHEIRANGELRGDARPKHPGVILSFTRNGRQISFPCDRYHNWRDNLRAIALSMEALRAVDRYGVSTGEEQYTGWARIEGPGAAAAKPALSKDEALRILTSAIGWGETSFSGDVSPQAIEMLFREAAKKTHPDAGGSAERFKQVHEARQALLG